MYDGYCSASMTSQTYAIKAQRLLAKESIPCKIVRFDGERSRSGCSYGIEFPCEHTGNVKNILSKNRIRATHFYRGEKEI